MFSRKKKFMDIKVHNRKHHKTSFHLWDYASLKAAVSYPVFHSLIHSSCYNELLLRNNTSVSSLNQPCVRKNRSKITLYNAIHYQYFILLPSFSHLI